jgi:tRNA-intron lyase
MIPYAKPKRHTVNFESFNYLNCPPERSSYYNAFYIQETGQILVCDPEHARDLYRGGFFGKGTLSRSGPVTLDDTNIQNLNVQVEYLQLTLEEAFYLLSKESGLNILQIHSISSISDRNSSESQSISLSESECWNLFTSLDQTFPTNYALYAKFRKHGWVVRSGLKFGGKYVIYRKGPAFFHASYNVRTTPDNDRSSPIVSTWRDLVCWNRVTSSVSKKLVIARVESSNFTFITMQRWSPKGNRE